MPSYRSLSLSLSLILVGWLTLAWPASAVPAEPPVPAPVLGHARAYVLAVNDDGDAAIKAFHEDHSTPEIVEAVPFQAVAGYFRHHHRVLGGVDLVEVRMTGPATAVALMRSRRYGALFAVTFNLDSAQNLKVIEFDPGPAPDWAPVGPPLQSAAIAEQARVLADGGCKAGAFSGAWLIAKGRDVLAQGACGQANRRYGVANTVDTRINLGSMDKMFTSVAVMQLVEAGKLSLDDTLDRHLDESWLPAEVSRRIKIRHLLTHTSGLDSNFLGAEFRRSSPVRFRALADYKPLVHDEKPAFEPGRGYLYSNTGMLLLGAVIEKASGEDYYAYVQSHIFAPLGMNDTGSWSLEDPVPDVAMGYFEDPKAPLGWRENTLRNLYRGVPAGGGYSTVGDIHRFAMGLAGDRLISPASREWMWTRNLPNEYGAGFMITGSQAGRIVGHEGMFAGVSSQLEIYADKGYVVVILGNQDWAAPGLGDAFRGLVAAGR